MMVACTICGGDSCEYSLPLTKEDGKWIVKPLCGKCRLGLFREARAAGKSIMIYGLEGSLKEVERRNWELGRYQPFLDAFARAKPDEKVIRKNDKKSGRAKAEAR